MKRMVMAASALLTATFVVGAGCSSDGGGGGSGGSGGSSATGGSGGRGGSSGSTGGSGGSTGGSTGGSSATGGSGGSTGGSGGTGGSTGGSGGSGGTGGTGGSGGTGGAGGSSDGGTVDRAGDGTASEGGGGSGTMSFFVTSEGAGMGGNLGGLDGADAKCKALATAVSAALGAKNWKAYLSTSTVNARDRIGQGPWRNQKGEIIANNLTQLHDQGENGMLNSTWPIGAMAVAKILDEKGNPVPSGNPQRHDILTGTNMMGMVDGNNHCTNWTSSSAMVNGTVGHSNRAGGGRPPSWTSAHPSACAPVGSGGPNVGSGGGQGSIYCFAAE